MSKLKARIRSWLIISLIILGFVVISTLFEKPTEIMFSTGLGLDLFIIIICLLLFFHGVKTEGLETSLSLFLTAFIFFGGAEAFWVYIGKTDLVPHTYTYNIGYLRFLGIPFLIGSGWFIWVYAAYKLIVRGFAKHSIWVKSLLAGFFGLAIDFCTDPAAVNIQRASSGSAYWEWSVQNTQTLFTVPIYNFWGWFVSMFIVIFLYDQFWVKRKELNRYLLAMVAIFILSLLLIKVPRILADILFGEMHFLPIPFTEGGIISIDKIGMFAVIGIGILGLFILAIAHKRIWDWFFYTGFLGGLVYNLFLVFTLQKAFPTSWIIYIVFPSILFILGFCWRYALSNSISYCQQ